MFKSYSQFKFDFHRDKISAKISKHDANAILQIFRDSQKQNIQQVCCDEDDSQLQYIKRNSVASDEKNSSFAEIILKHVSQKITEKTSKSSIKRTQTVNTMKKMKFKLISSTNDAVEKRAKLNTKNC